MLNFQEPILLPILALLLLTVTALLVYRRTNPVLASFVRIGLVILRVIAILLIVLVLVRPLLGISYVSQVSPLVAVLVDNSASMQIKDQGKSRGTIADSILSIKAWKEVSQKAKIEYYSFSDVLIKARKLNYSGKSTSLSQALLGLKNRSPELSALVLITDGGHNLGPDPVAIAGQVDFPVYTIGLGSEGLPLDLGITDLDYPEEVFVGTKARIRLSVSSSGITEQKLKIALKEEGKILQEQEILLAGKGRKIPVTLQIDPQKEGVKRYELSLPRLEGEISYKNNQRQFSLRVQKSKLKILCVAGNLNWEYHFFKKFLESQKNLDQSYVVYDGQKLLQGNFPRKPEELSDIDLIILVNPEYNLLEEKSELFNGYVSKPGKPLLLLLDHSFWPVPATKADLGCLPFDPGGLTVYYRQFNFRLEEPAQASPLFRLSENSEESQKLWQDLPPFLGALLPAKINLEARVLATYQSEEGVPNPVLLTQEFGTGKVMTSLAFPYWRWDFLLTGLGKENQAYARFWSNVMRWLTAQKKTRGLELTTGQLVYQAGEKIEFKAIFRDELGEAETEGEMKVKVRNLSSGSQHEVTMVANADKEYEGTLNFLEPGEYVVEASYNADGKTLGKVKQQFQVEEYSLEDQTLTMNRQLLSQMAEVSGGKFYTISNFENLPKDLVLQERRVEKQKSWEIWNQPVILIFALAFLSLEWFLRKRHQLP